MTTKRKLGVTRTITDWANKIMPEHLRQKDTIVPKFDTEEEKRFYYDYYDKALDKEAKKAMVPRKPGENSFYLSMRISDQKKSSKDYKNDAKRIKYLEKKKDQSKTLKLQYKKALVTQCNHMMAVAGHKWPAYDLYIAMIATHDGKVMYDALKKDGLVDDATLQHMFYDAQLHHFHTSDWRKKRKGQSHRWRQINNATYRQISKLPNYKELKYSFVQ